MKAVKFQPRRKRLHSKRRGIVIVITVFCLAVCMMFTAFSIDVGRIALTRTDMQNSVDSAALAAAMEITAAVHEADESVEDVVAFAQAQARLKAAEVAAAMDIHVDPDIDVEFGKRLKNVATGNWETIWGESPANVVRVTARRNNNDVHAADGKLRLAFAGKKVAVKTTAVAFIEPRDIVTVLDFSRSMNFDSYFASEYNDPNAQLPQADIEANMQQIWQDLGSPAYGSMPFTPGDVTIPSTDNAEVLVTWRTDEVDFVANDYDDSSDFDTVKLYFSNGNTQYFYPDASTKTYTGTGSNANKRITKVKVKDDGIWETFDFYDNDHIKRGLGLNGVSYPYPVGSWDRYIEMARDHSSSMTNYYQSEIYQKGYRRKFGTLTFIHYLLRFEPGYWETPDLWKTRHYPFHAVKEGHEMFCDFLQELNFDDHTGIVSYDTYHRVEDVLNEPGLPSVDISAKPVTKDYAALKTIMQHKQCAHYAYATNVGGGLKDAKQLLESEGRPDARPTILLMTDGNTNTMDSGESSTLPADWDWDELFDYDNDGTADYVTSSDDKKYVLKIAKECYDAGFIVHTMSVGSDADDDLMRAIAHLTNGYWLDIPGGTSTSQMQAEVEDAFARIASSVPPARLLLNTE